MKRPTFDEIYMEVVDIIARRSTCLRKHVGAVITIDNRILSHGYNGVPSGHVHCCDTGICQKDANSEEYKICIHAEQNAICRCAKRGLALEGATIYVNADVCITCAKLIVASGIARCVVRRDFKSADGIELMRKSGVIVDIYDK
ncbi:MAG: CMP deaminase [Abditibacteriota bacterium]|nr:CMP deaminase [Abditibacteriota bacterium]MBP5094124.1 CMP deaminase [Abditibacteriota bacterium]MBP5718646.1 CMP deaminase [Abditibacteriota bacterium]MBP5737641.1 CMP deaminase [Abditibacteriota bacterium]